MSGRATSAIALARRRRKELAGHFDLRRQFGELEESCVPSYLHANPAAAAVSWWRLFAAARLIAAHAPAGPLLDFGAATGELAGVLAARGGTREYHFAERDETLAAALMRFRSGAVRHAADSLPPARFACVAALDSLEHNADVAAEIDRLIAALRPNDGVLVVCGPTESRLYRLGRRIAGFSGDYHTTTIADIETLIGRRMRRVALRRLPLPGFTLFRLSVWRHG